jgi:SAM-dependent methyltransferase
MRKPKFFKPKAVKVISNTQKQSSFQQRYPDFQSLHDSESALKNYYRFVSKLISKSIPRHTASVLDFGAGQGLFTGLIEEATGIKPDCVELDPVHLKLLSKRGFETFQSLSQTSKLYDIIFSKDVLEHIEDDRGALLELHGKLNEGGMLLLYVPALPFIYSGLDVSVGHFRRYGKGEIIEKVKLSGFDVLRVQYVDVIGVVTGFLLRFIGRGSTQKAMNYRMFRLYDLLLFPISLILDAMGFRNLVGKNLYLVAVKKSQN